MHIPLLLPLLIPLAQCTHLRVLIASTTGLSNPGTLPPSTSASLTTLSRQLHAPLRADNSFDFRNVSAGSYLLDIHSHTYEFAPLRVDVHGEVETRTVEPEVQVWGTFRGNEWGNKGEKVDVTEIEKEDKGEAIFAFAVKARGKKEYLVKKQGFSPLSILQNPMILIAIVSMGVVFGMPYLMDNMDPEMRAEFEERQKSSPLGGGQVNPLQDFDPAAWLAGSSGKKSEGSGSKKIEAPVERGVSR